eukprot:TRINITY_DN593_c0_g3_i1.p2 TRINITY_DN593_c0_g3~~TRINITY_DN593_c0_g3_i1.p2  ORF type:complete len:357 (+),score=126.57 TRINITY_DN593_c0_g3_i1:59-1129(+)
MRSACVLIGAAAVSAQGISGIPGVPGTGPCIAPGVCKPPARKNSWQVPIKPRQQWNIDGGYCGQTSVAVMLMAHGAWVSGDLIRKANDGSLCYGHGEPGYGCEVGPENYNTTAAGLKTYYDVWDFTQPQPQAPAFKAWIKKHLTKKTPVMWAPICAGDSHTPYGPRSCPNGGHFDHHEPILGLGSNHDLSDPTVYDDDWLLHFSDQDLQTYYRTFDTLQDSAEMDGNCKDANPEHGKNEMYPCFYEQVTYGLAIEGLIKPGASQRTMIDVDIQREPNVRKGEPPAPIHATVWVYDLVPGKTYTIYRYADAIPTTNWEDGYEHKMTFVAESDSFGPYTDPNAFMSNTARFYAVPTPH